MKRMGAAAAHRRNAGSVPGLGPARPKSRIRNRRKSVTLRAAFLYDIAISAEFERRCLTCAANCICPELTKS